MPNCFKIFPKGESEPICLNKLDEKICQHINVPVHQKQYGGGVFDWFNSIGFVIAMNTDCNIGSEKLRNKLFSSTGYYPENNDEFSNEQRKYCEATLNYLEENYTSYAFYSGR